MVSGKQLGSATKTKSPMVQGNKKDGFKQMTPKGRNPQTPTGKTPLSKTPTGKTPLSKTPTGKTPLSKTPNRGNASERKVSFNLSGNKTPKFAEPQTGKRQSTPGSKVKQAMKIMELDDDEDEDDDDFEGGDSDEMECEGEDGDEEEDDDDDEEEDDDDDDEEEDDDDDDEEDEDDDDEDDDEEEDDDDEDESDKIVHNKSSNKQSQSPLKSENITQVPAKSATKDIISTEIENKSQNGSLSKNKVESQQLSKNKVESQQLSKNKVESQQLSQNKVESPQLSQNKDESKQKKKKLNSSNESRDTRNLRTLFVGALPLNITSKELKALSPDIVEVNIPKRTSTNRKRLYGFVLFANEQKAEENFVKFKTLKLRGEPLKYDYCGVKSSSPHAKTNVEKGCKKLKIEGLPLKVTIDKIASIFSNAVLISVDDLVGIRKATIVFKCVLDAETSFELNKDATIDGKPISLFFANSPPKRPAPFSNEKEKPAAKKAKIEHIVSKEDDDDVDDDDDDDDNDEDDDESD